MLTARLFSILLFLCYHLTSTNAIYTDNVFCVPLAHRQMPTIASCYAAIDSMSSNTLAVQYAPGLRLGVSSGDCQIHIQQILGTPAYHPTMGQVASTEHILWRFVKWKATEIVQSCFEERSMSIGTSTVAGYHQGTTAMFQIVIKSAL